MRLVGLSGYARSGKDTAAEMLGHDGLVRVAFADKLKALALDLDPILDWSDGTRTVQFSRLSRLLEDLGPENAKKIPSVRKFYQDLGNKVREHLGSDTWVNAALESLEPGYDYVFSDVRYPNEADAIRMAGGEIWRINRPGTGPVNDHVSETAIDDYNFDRVFDNDSTLEDLEREVLAALAHVHDYDDDNVLCY